MINIDKNPKKYNIIIDEKLNLIDNKFIDTNKKYKKLIL